MIAPFEALVRSWRAIKTPEGWDDESASMCADQLAELCAAQRSAQAAETSLRERIEKRIASLESCSHQLCSTTESISEAIEAKHLRQLLCEHAEWKTYKAPDWVIGPYDPNNLGGCYCAACGLASYEL